MHPHPSLYLSWLALLTFGRRGANLGQKTGNVARPEREPGTLRQTVDNICLHLRKKCLRELRLLRWRSRHYVLRAFGAMRDSTPSQRQGEHIKGIESMAARAMKLPGPDHPITIEGNRARVVVRIAGRVVADTREALTLREASYPAVQYIPRKNVDMSLLERTDHATYCPYKGDCAYYSIPLGGERSNNAVWTYEQPYPTVGEIKDYLAFYPDRVDAVEET